MMFFRKKSSELYPPKKPKIDHFRFTVEKDGQERLLSLAEFEKEFQIRFLPHLEFEKLAYFRKVANKTAHFLSKGYLGEEQLWLGAYFKEEILSCSLPPVRLRWIDKDLGWGVFAERDLKPMEYIGEYTGLVRKRRRKDVKNSYCFEMLIGPGDKTPYTIDALEMGGMARFINHSDTPNLSSALATTNDFPHVILFVEKVVSKGEQLCYDYGADYWKKRTSPKQL